MMFSNTILRTNKTMALADVRAKLALHIGERVIVRTDFNGGYSFIMGTLERYGDHIGLEEKPGNGWKPHETDARIAELY